MRAEICAEGVMGGEISQNVLRPKDPHLAQAIEYYTITTVVWWRTTVERGIFEGHFSGGRKIKWG